MAKKDKRLCGVICETTGKVFKSIRDASRYADANDWTMSLKMTAMGQFVDREGRVYKRLKPMNSKNVYTTCSDKVTKKVKKRKTRTVSHGLPIVDLEPLPNIQGSVDFGPFIKKDGVLMRADNEVSVKEEVSPIVKKALEEKAISLLKEHGIYYDVIALLKAAGHKVG